MRESCGDVPHVDGLPSSWMIAGDGQEPALGIEARAEPTTRPPRDRAAPRAGSWRLRRDRFRGCVVRGQAWRGNGHRARTPGTPMPHGESSGGRAACPAPCRVPGPRASACLASPRWRASCRRERRPGPRQSPHAPRAARSRGEPVARGSARRSRGGRIRRARAGYRGGCPGPARIVARRAPAGRAAGSRHSGADRPDGDALRRFASVAQPHAPVGRRERSGSRAAGCATPANWPTRLRPRRAPRPAGRRGPSAPR